MTTVYYTISDGLGHYLMVDPTSLGSIKTGNDPNSPYAQWSGKYIQNRGNNFFLSFNNAGLRVQSTVFLDFTLANNSNPNIILLDIINNNIESRGYLMVGNNPNSYLAVDNNNSDNFLLGPDPENDILTHNYNMVVKPVSSTNPIIVPSTLKPISLNTTTSKPISLNTTTSKPIYATTTTAIPISSSNTGLIIGLSVGSVVLIILLLILLL